MDTSTEMTKNQTLTTGFDWMATLIGALITVVVVFTFLFRMVTVDGNSMLNTLHHGDRLVMITEFYSIQRGDVVVVARAGAEPLIKRVIAVGGDTIAIDRQSGQVILNGKPLDEPYVFGDATPTFGFEGPYTLRDGEVFVMGDNRSDSKDSRQLGVFSVDDILGETVFRLLPLSSLGRIE